MKKTDVWMDDEIVCDISPNHALLVFEYDTECEVFKNWWEKIGKSEFVKYFNKKNV